MTIDEYELALARDLASRLDAQTSADLHLACSSDLPSNAKLRSLATLLTLKLVAVERDGIRPTPDGIRVHFWTLNANLLTLITRLKAELDETRVSLCHATSNNPGEGLLSVYDPENTPRAHAQNLWGPEEALRLFPEDAPPIPPLDLAHNLFTLFASQCNFTVDSIDETIPGTLRVSLSRGPRVETILLHDSPQSRSSLTQHFIEALERLCCLDRNKVTADALDELLDRVSAPVGTLRERAQHVLSNPSTKLRPHETRALHRTLQFHTRHGRWPWDEPL
jgi:hypothetical protein